MIISGKSIERYVSDGTISISGFDPKNIGPNSYDVTLNKFIKTYAAAIRVGNVFLDMKEENPVDEYEIPQEGYILRPNILYIATTNEYIKSGPFIPMINGRSSLGRLGISIHQTAGFCDYKFEGKLTLEITVVHPVKIYPNVRIAQVCWYPIDDETSEYHYTGKYLGQMVAQESKMYEDKEFK